VKAAIFGPSYRIYTLVMMERLTQTALRSGQVPCFL
jgi:hypothetical protein